MQVDDPNHPAIIIIITITMIMSLGIVVRLSRFTRPVILL